MSNIVPTTGVLAMPLLLLGASLSDEYPLSLLLLSLSDDDEDSSESLLRRDGTGASVIRMGAVGVWLWTPFPDVPPNILIAPGLSVSLLSSLLSLSSLELDSSLDDELPSEEDDSSSDEEELYRPDSAMPSRRVGSDSG